jgi:adenine-specific DNA methylase
LIIGAGVDEAQKEVNKQGITQAEFDSIEQGTTQQEVERQLGTPEDSQEFEQEIPAFQNQPSRSSCIYYPEKDQPLFEGQSFQFCFDEERLTSKNAY